MVFFSPNLIDTLNKSQSEATRNVITFVTDPVLGINRDTSFAVCDSGWKLQYDVFSDKYRWIPLNADIAGLCAQTETDFDAWWSPAGLNRGKIKNIISLAFNPNKASRDELYKRNINSVVSFTGEGTILYGDRTLQVKNSAFSYINVRRLFIVLEKSIGRAAKYQLFEFNDTFTRNQFVGMITPYLRTVQAKRGIYDFKVVCDESNNTPDVIDSAQFIASIFIKPARSINFITLNFVAVRTGVEFSEVVGVV
jgi:phage tail sheath protein FI